MKILKFLALILIIISTNTEWIYSQVKILPLGNSITQGKLLVVSQDTKKLTYKPDRYRGLRADGAHGILASGSGGYRLPLEQMLYDSGWDLEMVGRRTEGGGHHEGYPGYMTHEIIPMLDEILEVNDPDLILLHIGTNDLPRPNDAEECFDNIVEMLEIIHDFNPDIKVVLAQIVPCLQNTDLGEDRYPEIIDLNNLLKNVPYRGNFVTLVDMWTPFVSTDNWESVLMSDSWHPNDDGYYLMAEIWLHALIKIISGRSPEIAAVTPSTGFVYDDSFDLTISGEFFESGMQALLISDNGDELKADDVTVTDNSNAEAVFDLTESFADDWRLEVVNPTKMRSIHTTDFFITLSSNDFTISGFARDEGNNPIDNVKILLSSSTQSWETTTNSNGYYRFNNLPGGHNYEIRAHLNGYRFRPGTIKINDIHENYSELDFNGTGVQLSGTLADSDGQGCANVVLLVTGAKDTILYSNNNGEFSLTPAPGGELTIKPEKQYWEFLPQQHQVTIDTNDVALTFEAIYQPPYFSLSGQLFDGETGQEIQGAELKLSGYQSATTITDTLGRFQFDDLEGFQDYTLTPIHSDYDFQPENLIINNLNSDQLVKFDGIYRAIARQISGVVQDEDGNSAQNVTIDLSGPVPQQTETDENGQFGFQGLAPREDYVIFSSDPLVKLTPDSIRVENLEQDISDINFRLEWHKFSPRIIGLSSQKIKEGESFQSIELNNFVQDEDSEPSEISWQVINNSPVQSIITEKMICNFSIPDPDWYGTAQLTFIATDKDGLTDSARVNLSVENVNDPPRPFNLAGERHVKILPSIRYQFDWERATDPDSEETISYEVFVGTDSFSVFDEPLLMLNANSDTTLKTSIWLASDDYFWSVQASDPHGALRNCSEIGTLRTGISTSLTEETNKLPTEFALRQNFPNPFNPVTTIQYDLPRTTQVSIIIYDNLGQQVKQLVYGSQPCGHHQIIWDGKNSQGKSVSSGRYFARMKADDFQATIEMTFIK